ncbi:MAG: hypothetical protein IKE62_01680 [Oscillospiraceae bacterium]|nr:hypothetical protein [Oscillospiraceae bacterium]
MTERENILRLFRGEMPAWLPKYGGLGAGPASKAPTANVMVSFMDGFTKDGSKDIWGVPYMGAESVNGATMPAPGVHILEDITEWRDVIKAPNLDEIDFEKMAAKDCADVDRVNSAMGLSLYCCWLQGLISFMGFEEALVSFYEEPEEAHALLEYVGNFLNDTLKRAIVTYKPDFVMFTEDSAAAGAPFISVEMYREFLKPVYKSYCDIALNAGLPVVHHNCGFCQDYIPEWIDLGVGAWEPAQVMNDLDAIKATYGRKLAICGGWDPNTPAMQPGASEEVVRETVRAYIDRFAPDGGFGFCAHGLKIKSTEEDFQRHKWIQDEYEQYGRHWYDHH